MRKILKVAGITIALTTVGAVVKAKKDIEILKNPIDNKDIYRLDNTIYRLQGRVSELEKRF